jgi:hypothetical protein
MVTGRLEVRLDPRRRDELERLADERDATVSELLREAIDLLLDEDKAARRHAAAERLSQTSLDYDLPDPETLSRELSEAHDPGIH